MQRIILFLSEVLGYDPLTEITRESQIRDKYVDGAVKIDRAIRWLIEAKAAPVPLRSRHLDQLYASESNQSWVVLTNERVFEVDLATIDDMDRAAELHGRDEQVVGPHGGHR